MTLLKVEKRKPFTVERIGGCDELRDRLHDFGIFEGTVLSVCRTAPLGDPLILDVGGEVIAIRKSDAAFIDVLPAEVAPQ
jgi:Fe2+ transport system protein FeoA